MNFLAKHFFDYQSFVNLPHKAVQLHKTVSPVELLSPFLVDPLGVFYDCRPPPSQAGVDPSASWAPKNMNVAGKNHPAPGARANRNSAEARPGSHRHGRPSKLQYRNWGEPHGELREEKIIPHKDPWMSTSVLDGDFKHFIEHDGLTNEADLPFTPKFSTTQSPKRVEMNVEVLAILTLGSMDYLTATVKKIKGISCGQQPFVKVQLYVGPKLVEERHSSSSGQRRVSHRRSSRRTTPRAVVGNHVGAPHPPNVPNHVGHHEPAPVVRRETASEEDDDDDGEVFVEHSADSSQHYLAPALVESAEIHHADSLQSSTYVTAANSQQSSYLSANSDFEEQGGENEELPKAISSPADLAALEHGSEVQVEQRHQSDEPSSPVESSISTAVERAAPSDVTSASAKENEHPSMSRPTVSLAETVSQRSHSQEEHPQNTPSPTQKTSRNQELPSRKHSQQRRRSLAATEAILESHHEVDLSQSFLLRVPYNRLHITHLVIQVYTNSEHGEELLGSCAIGATSSTRGALHWHQMALKHGTPVCMWHRLYRE
ncbi:Protein DH11.5 e [Aphelenchoides avenae]|nr:Protein DH11.5 e [Aphelenchus avenae]